MRKRKLNQREIKQLRRYWEKPDAFEQALWSLFSEDVKHDIERQVTAEMAQEGKHFTPDTASIWGGERARRELERLLAEIRRYLHERYEMIHHAICVDFEYCRRKKENEFQSDHFTLVIAVADALLPAVTGVPLPITTITVYALRYGVLDNWCACQ